MWENFLQVCRPTLSKHSTVLWTTSHQNYYHSVMREWIAGMSHICLVSATVQVSCYILYTLHYRLLLAALHFNDNSTRAQATVIASGEGWYKITHPKYEKGEHTVRKITVPPIFSMLWDILSLYWNQTAPCNPWCTLVLLQDMSMYFLKTSSRTSQSIRRVNLMLLHKWLPLLHMNSQINNMRLLDTSPATAKVYKINFLRNVTLWFLPKAHIPYSFILANEGT